VFPRRNSHKFTWTSPDWKTHIHTDHSCSFSSAYNATHLLFYVTPKLHSVH
jgi:hypothetical protein